jgi:hypothetical protein
MVYMCCESQLRGFLPDIFASLLTDFPPWPQELTFFFTEGKNNPENWWPKNVTRSANGVVLSAFRDEDRKVLVGAALIDFLQEQKPDNSSLRVAQSSSGKPSLADSKKSIPMLKISIFNTMAHEYVHFTQHWVVDTEKKISNEYSNIWKNVRQKIIEQSPNAPDDEIALNEAVYVAHPLEVDAKEYSKFKLKRYVMDITRGFWDSKLPPGLLDYLNSLQ